MSSDQSPGVAARVQSRGWTVAHRRELNTGDQPGSITHCSTRLEWRCLVVRASLASDRRTVALQSASRTTAPVVLTAGYAKVGDPPVKRLQPSLACDTTEQRQPERNLAGRYRGGGQQAPSSSSRRTMSTARRTGGRGPDNPYAARSTDSLKQEGCSATGRSYALRATTLASSSTARCHRPAVAGWQGLGAPAAAGWRPPAPVPTTALFTRQRRGSVAREVGRARTACKSRDVRIAAPACE